MQGLTLGQLIELYDKATPTEQELMRENIGEWFEQKTPAEFS